MKKLLALCLAVVMCLSTGVLVAYAADRDELVEKDVGLGDVRAVVEWNEGGEALSGESDVEATFDSEKVDAELRNVNKSQTITLKKGESKTYSFDVSGGLFSPDHNTVSVVITDSSGGSSYQYMSVNVTEGVELANLPCTGNTSRILSNLDPDDTYEITIVNTMSTSITLDVSITSYIS